ncbi:MAG: MFS transporter [Actinobacteria bacterium]|nr:MFS transporter [Actinomycetota bacterium]
MAGAGEQLRESREAIAAVFRNPGLRRLNIALVGSVLGDWAYAVAASVYAYTQGGATAVGVLGTVRYVLVALVLPFSSMLADRFDRRRVMIASDVSRAVLVCAAAAVIEFDGPPIVVYVLAVAMSLVGSPFRPAQAALMPTLAEHPSELTAANVASSTIESVGFFIGPAIAGVLLAVTDVATVYVFDALTFAWSAVVVMGLRTPDRAAEGSTVDGQQGDGDEADGPTSMFAGAGDGYREILRSRDLRLLIGLYCGQTVVAGASLVFGVAIALDLLDIGESGVGLLDAMTGIGGLAGGVVALLLAQRNRLARDFGLGVILWSAPLLLVAAWPTLASAIIAMVLIGLANSVVDVNAFTILQRLVPDAVMGRVFGAMESAVIGGMALGSLLMPLFINTIGLRGGLAVIGGTVTVLVLLGSAGLRRIDREVLAPVGLDLIRGVPMFAVLPEQAIERLAQAAEKVAVPSGRMVFGEGEPGDRFYVVESGRVDVTIRDEFVRSLGHGESFGEIALLRDIPRTATVTAAGDTVLRAIDRDTFIAVVTGHGDAAAQADQVVTWRLGIS